MVAILAPSSSSTMTDTKFCRRALTLRSKELVSVEISNRICVGTGCDCGQRARCCVWTIAHAGRCQYGWNTAVPIWWTDARWWRPAASARRQSSPKRRYPRRATKSKPARAWAISSHARIGSFIGSAPPSLLAPTRWSNDEPCLLSTLSRRRHLLGCPLRARSCRSRARCWGKAGMISRH